MAERPIILGCAGPRLSDWERAFFAAAEPHGFILFKRNCETPDQVLALTAELRDCIGRPEAPILVDQEGGRVQRLGPPHWPARPAAAVFGQLAALDVEAAREAVALNARLLGEELAACGITADCAPVLDLVFPETHEVIGDRAFAADPALVASLGLAFCESLAESGVLPIVKHVPGHGRATADSHLELPRVTAALADLEALDFAPFRALADAPWAMTAHIVYEAIDPEQPATTSSRLITETIRGDIGFAGILVSDDLSMAALSGSIAERGRAALAAGCDLALHCNGKPEEMSELCDALPAMTAETVERLAAAQAKLPADVRRLGPGQRQHLQERLDALLSPVMAQPSEAQA